VTADLATGAVVFVAGLVALSVQRGRVTGMLLCAVGAAWFAGSVAAALVFLHRGPLVQLLLAYPRGRVHGRARLALLVAAYVCVVEPVGAAIGRPLFALVLLAAAERWWRTGGIERRAAASALAAAVLVCSAAIAEALVAYEVAVALVAVALTVDVLLGGWARGVITGLMLDVGRLQAPLAEALGRAVGDRSLAIAHREGSDWVDEAGRALDPRRVMAPISATAALVHDPMALADPELARATVAAARLALGNAALNAEVAARVAELEASARRLVTAGDAERRRLARTVEEGPERTLEEVASRLARDFPELARATAEAGEQLRAFATGLRCPRLAADGLKGALRELEADAQVPDERFDPVVEATVYFVCSEALANAAKYANASAVRVTVERRRDRLVAAVADDGVGGADTGHGTGLRGLADRVEALGGRLTVSSPRGAGTIVQAELDLK
jgi:hypothetical protein